MVKRAYMFLLALMVVTAGCIASADSQPIPRNIILLIGDGMGPNQVLAAQLTRFPNGGKLTMQTLPVKTYIQTDNVEGKVTDSAAASTALATGVLTKNGMLGMDPEGRELKTIAQAARKQGRAAGIATTTPIAHATPAGFASHVPSRGEMTEIAKQMLNNGLEVMFGGGVEHFLHKSQEGSDRKDDWDGIAAARAKGYQVALTYGEFWNLSGPKALAPLSKGGLTTKAPEPTLADLTGKAIQILNQNPKGFLLVVEGGQIDWAGHANDLQSNIHHTLQFDDAVRRAYNFARTSGDTLVIVTADHETGGLEVSPTGGGKFDYKWTTGGHTSTKVPLYAYGPGAELFADSQCLTCIANKMASLWGVNIGHTSTVAEGK